jgi:predicted site-specific integrase-resolvase
MHEKPNDILLKPSDAARKFGVATTTIHVWRRRGHILAVKLPNGRYGIPQSEIERLSVVRQCL